MFGTYRTFLALAVVAHHLISIPVIGHYAVHGFFILSGYLMTYIMTNSYGYSLSGLKAFSINRFLRLYPSYWVILIFTIFVVLIFGEENSSDYRRYIYLPDTLAGVLQNISLLYFNFFPGGVSPRLSPPTWALTIELLFYLLIALGISRSKKMTILWFCISLIYMISTHIFELDYQYRYSFFIAGTFPFSIGAMIFHFQKISWGRFIKQSHPNTLIVLFMMFVLNAGLSAVGKKLDLPDTVSLVSFYLNVLINALIVFKLIDGRLPFISKELDAKIGNYSYPIYLLHWQAGFIASMIIFGSPIRGLSIDGIISLSVALIICFVISYLIIRFVDLPIEKYRKKVKKRLRSHSTQIQSENFCQVNVDRNQ